MDFCSFYQVDRLTKWLGYEAQRALASYGHAFKQKARQEKLPTGFFLRDCISNRFHQSKIPITPNPSQPTEAGVAYPTTR
jgi:hypothetical protein